MTGLDVGASATQRTFTVRTDVLDFFCRHLLDRGRTDGFLHNHVAALVLKIVMSTTHWAETRACLFIMPLELLQHFDNIGVVLFESLEIQLLDKIS